MKKELGTSAVEEGIASCEAANNAAAAGAFAPLLALDNSWFSTGAVLWRHDVGLKSRPTLLFTNEPDFKWGLIYPVYVKYLTW